MNKNYSDIDIEILRSQCLGILEWCDKMAGRKTILDQLPALLCKGNEGTAHFNSMSEVIKGSGTEGISLTHIGDKCRHISPVVRKKILKDLEGMGKIFTRKKRLGNNIEGFSRQSSTLYFWKI